MKYCRADVEYIIQKLTVDLAAYSDKMKEIRLRSRPIQRWRDNIEEDILEIGLTSLEGKVKNREGWRKTLSAEMRLNSSES